jgi:hypothetical protein
MLIFGLRNPSFPAHLTRNSVNSGGPNNIIHPNPRLPSSIEIWTIEVISSEPCKAHLELHPSQLCATSCSIFPYILLNFILYLLRIHSLPYSPPFCYHYPKQNLCPVSWGITIHRWIKKHTLWEHWHSRKEPIFIVHQMLAIHGGLYYGWLMSPDFSIESRWRYPSGAQW